MEKRSRPATPAARLRQALDEVGMKQIELSRRSGVDRGAISRYLSGEYEPKQEAIYRMALALNVSEMWLLGYDVPKERSAAQKKNDQLAQLVAQLRKDSGLLDCCLLLSKLPAEQRASLQQLLGSLLK